MVFSRSVVEGMLAAAREAHPREALMLLRGRFKGDRLVVEELLIPPLAVHGIGFASFNPYLLPLDPFIVGVAHSHPSGSPRPSLEDLDSAIGYIVVVVSYPYSGTSDVHVYSARGVEVPFEVC